jgi:hypothetical protein
MRPRFVFSPLCHAAKRLRGLDAVRFLSIPSEDFHLDFTPFLAFHIGGGMLPNLEKKRSSSLAERGLLPLATVRSCAAGSVDGVTSRAIADRSEQLTLRKGKLPQADQPSSEVTSDWMLLFEGNRE